MSLEVALAIIDRAKREPEWGQKNNLAYRRAVYEVDQAAEVAARRLNDPNLVDAW